MGATPLRILKSTRENWSKNLADETIEQHPLLALLKEKGLIEYNVDGTDLKWTAKYKEAPLIPYADFDDLEFSRQDKLQVAQLDTRGYKAVDAISEKEMLQNKGQHAIIKLFGKKAEDMKTDASSKLCAELYVDGNASGNDKRFHGLESFMAVTTGSQTAADQEATVYADSYGGLSTAKGAFGGSAGMREFDFWTPTVVSTNATGQTWATHSDVQMRYAISETTFGHSEGNALDLILLSRPAFRSAVNLLATKERVIVDKSEVGIRKFGFKDTFNLDGVDVTFDPDLPTTDATPDTVYGYGLTTGAMSLKILNDQLWTSGDAFDPDRQAFKWWVGLYGNLVFRSPRHFVKFVDLV